MTENTEKIKEFVERLANLMTVAPEDPRDDPDWSANDWAGGNIDDAWQQGFNAGWDQALLSVVWEARKLLGLPTD